MTINPWQRQILLGTLLGSGYIQRSQNRLYLGMSESRDVNWFQYKAVELTTLAAPTPIVQCRGVWKWRGVSGSVWEPYAGNIMDMDMLNPLRDIGVAIWFGDKGFWYSTRRVGLRASKFDTRKPALDFFNQVGMSCEESRKAIVFTPSGTEALLQLIAPVLPVFMHYKLSATQSIG